MPTYAEHFLFPNVWFRKVKKNRITFFFLSLQGLKSYKVYEIILRVRFPLKRDLKKCTIGFYRSRIICFQFTELFISINNFKRVKSSVLCLMRFISTIYFDNSKNCLQVTPTTAITIAFLLVGHKRLPTYFKYCAYWSGFKWSGGDDKTDFVLVKIWRRFGIRSSRMTIKKSLWYE